MRLTTLLLTTLFFSTSLLAGGKPEPPEWVSDIPEKKVIEWRRYLHENPELSFQEEDTSDYVAQVLESFGTIEVIRPTSTSVIGILEGNSPGATVAFRADMDALAVQEETGL